jgi:hypothetical protein
MTNELLALADLKDWTEEKIKVHLATEYAEECDYWEDNAKRKFGEPDLDFLKNLDNYDILVAYESVGEYGCDSSGWFLLKDKQSNKLFEINGSHCSCFGFEGQGNLSEVTIEALQLRSGYDLLSTGGYDNDEETNKEQVKKYIQKLAQLNKSK